VPVRRILALLAVALMVAAGATPVAARSDDRAKPVILIHGSDWAAPFGVGCASSFNEMRDRFRDWGHTGPIVKLAYYRYDRGCDHDFGHHRGHAQHHASGHDSTGGHTGGTSIRHLGYHLAWYIYDHYTRIGQPVDVVGHSMAGVVIRYALAQVERGHASFPPRLLVEDVVTLGAPHDGVKPIIETCPTRQCRQMEPNSAFLTWLRFNAWEPDGLGGTDWTVIGAVDDNYVTAASGVAMGACHKVKYLGSSNVEHSDLLHDASDAQTADVERQDCPGGWLIDRSWDWPVRATDRALAFGGR
jgi:hypothetical protein